MCCVPPARDVKLTPNQTPLQCSLPIGCHLVTSLSLPQDELRTGMDTHVQMLVDLCAAADDNLLALNDFLLPDDHPLVLAELSKMMSAKESANASTAKSKKQLGAAVGVAQNEPSSTSKPKQWELDLIAHQSSGSVTETVEFWGHKATAWGVPWFSLLTERQQSQLAMHETSAKVQQILKADDHTEVIIDLSQSYKRQHPVAGRELRFLWSDVVLHSHLA